MPAPISLSEIESPPPVHYGSFERCTRSLPPPRAFEPPSHYNDSSHCAPWYGFRRGPAYRLRMPLVDVCVNDLAPPTGDEHGPRSSLRCVLQRGEPFFCEMLHVRLGQLFFNEPPLRASCQWRAGVLSAERSSKYQVAPWTYSDATLPTRVMSLPFSQLELSRGWTPDRAPSEPRSHKFSQLGVEQLFNSIHVNQSSKYPACDPADRVVSHPVLLVRRHDAFNPFHAHEMIFSVWSSFLALELEPCDTSILFSDMIDDDANFGPFLEFYRAVFAPVHGVDKMATLAMMNQQTCYKRLITTVNHEEHFNIPYEFSVAMRRNLRGCSKSPYVMGMTNYVLHAFGLERDPTSSRRVPHVSLLRRQPYTRERHLSAFDTRRMMKNFPELELAVSTHCSRKRRDLLRGRECTQMTVDMATLPIAGQLAMARATDVLIGTHSAALVYLIYLPAHACVVEFATKTDFHYDNLAFYTGIHHIRVMNRLLTHSVRSFYMDVQRAILGLQMALKYVSPFVSAGIAARVTPPPTPRHIEWPQVTWETSS